MLRKASIWILEDEKGARFVYERVLSYQYSLEFFSGMQELREALRSSGDRPALLIADLWVDDGCFTDFLSADGCVPLRGIPWVVVSSVDDIDVLRFCFSSGATDYLVKPFKKSELLVKIERILVRKSDAFTLPE